MNIIEKKYKRFEQIEEGQVFKYNSNYWLKISEISIGVSQIIANAVLLENGEAVYLKDNTEVETVQCNLVIIN